MKWVLVSISLHLGSIRYSFSESKVLPLFETSFDGDYSITTDCEAKDGTCKIVDLKINNLVEIITKNETKFSLPAIQAKEKLEFTMTDNVWNDVGGYMVAVFTAQDESSAFLVFDTKKHSVHGTFRIKKDVDQTDIYTLVNCGFHCHKLALSKDIHGEGEDAIDLSLYVPGGLMGDYGEEEEQVAAAKEMFVPMENKTLATVTVTFYITPEFMKEYNDPYGEISLLVEQVNKGYELNHLPIKLVIHCIMKAPFSESDPGWIEGEGWQKAQGAKKTKLFKFANLDKPENKWNTLRHSADMAYLLLSGEDNPAGESIIFPMGQYEGASLGYVYTLPAHSQYSLDHEIGHIFGCQHTADSSKNKHLKYGYAHYVDTENGEPSGIRSIMAYRKEGYKERTHYYSSPDTSLNTDSGKVVMGEEGLTDNRRVMWERRFQVAAIGDETMECKSEFMRSEKKQDLSESNVTEPITVGDITETSTATGSDIFRSKSIFKKPRQKQRPHVSNIGFNDDSNNDDSTKFDAEKANIIYKRPTNDQPALSWSAEDVGKRQRGDLDAKRRQRGDFDAEKRRGDFVGDRRRGDFDDANLSQKRREKQVARYSYNNNVGRRQGRTRPISLKERVRRLDFSTIYRVYMSLSTREAKITLLEAMEPRRRTMFLRWVKRQHMLKKV